MRIKNRKVSQREHERIAVAMPVHAPGLDGTTRDVSVGGMYLEMQGAGEVGSELRFEVEVETPMGKMLLQCNGQVIRKELSNGKTGIAVRVVESVLQAKQAV